MVCNMHCGCDGTLYIKAGNLRKVRNVFDETKRIGPRDYWADAAGGETYIFFPNLQARLINEDGSSYLGPP